MYKTTGGCILQIFSGRVFFILILVGIPKPALIQVVFHIVDTF